MSFDPPAGILDIGNATLRVGKLEVSETTGLNQGLQNIVKNDLLITENNESSPYTTSNAWGVKLPTAWVGEFEVKGQSGKYIEFNFYNEGSTSNALGYTLNFEDTSLTLKYDNGNTLATATIPTIVGTFRKVNIFFERGVIAVSIDGTQYLYHKETDGSFGGLGVAYRVTSATGGAFVNLFVEANSNESLVAFKNLRIVNGRFISDKTSNVSFIGSLGVGVNSPQEALDIRGNMHFNRASNVSQVSVDSNVVTEYTGPHDRPLRKYPEVNFPLSTSSESPAIGATTFTYKSYTVTGNSVYNDANSKISRAFDGEEHVTSWTGNLGDYDSNGDVASGKTANYLQIQLPNAIKLEKMKIISDGNYQYANGPRNITLYGSNNGSNWVTLKTETDLQLNNGKSNPDPQTVFVHVNATTKYMYYKLEISKIWISSGGATYARIGEWELYGHEEGSASLDTTLKTVYNAPATTGTQLEFYYDAKDLADGAITTVTDLSPKDNTATKTGDPQISNGAFVFDGSDYIYNSQSGYTGVKTYTASVWFKRTADAGGCIFQFGKGAGGESIGMYYLGLPADGLSKLRAYIFGNAAADYDINLIPKNQWIHATAVYNDKTATLYVNGVQVIYDTGTTGLTIPATPYLSIGVQTDNSNYPYSTSYFTGSVANFRLYAKAMNADQVKELYDYQKDYFFGSKSQVTLYKGRLGVGVAEPSGQLELAGGEALQEYPPRAMTGFDMNVEGHGTFTATASSYYNATAHLPWQAFTPVNTSGSPLGWNTGSGSVSNTGYYSTSGAPAYATTSAAMFQGTRGEWVQLKCPYPVIVKRFAITGRSNNTYIGSPEDQPASGLLYGSNDGTTWDVLTHFTGLTYGGNGVGHGTTAGGIEIVEVNATKGYTHLLLQATARVSSNSTDSWLNIGRIQYFGIPDPTTIDKGSLSLTRSLDVPRISRYHVNTETPRPEALCLDYDTSVSFLAGSNWHGAMDLSGKENHGQFLQGAFYSTEYKAFQFDQTTLGDTIWVNKDGANLGLPTGDAIYTMSMWLRIPNSTRYAQRHSNPALFYFGSAWATSQLAGLYLRGGTKIGSDIGSTAIYTTNDVIKGDKWHHIVTVKRGTGNSSASNSYIRIFIDGVEIEELSMDGTARQQGLGTIDHISIGNTFYGSVGSYQDGINGWIAKPQIWNVALEKSEIEKIYRLGWCGKSMVIGDTAIGMGKHPEAQLDVRGLLKASCMHVPGTVVQVQAANMVGDSSTTDKNSGHKNSFVKLYIKPRFKNSAIIADFKFIAYIHGGSSAANGVECLVRRCVNLNPTNLSQDGVNVYYVSGGHNIHYYADNPNADHVYISLTEVDTPNTTEGIYYVMAFRPHNHGNHTISIGNGSNQYATVRLMEIAQ